MQARPAPARRNRPSKGSVPQPRDTTPGSRTVLRRLRPIHPHRAGAFSACYSALLCLCMLLTACGDPPDTPAEAVSAGEESVLEHAIKHLDSRFVCPMHPQINRAESGSCPICGMDLVARDMDEAEEDRPAVTLSAAVVQNLGLRTASIERGTMWKYIKTQGKVAYDDDRIIQVHPRTSGWIENLYVRTDGVRVKRKDDLADYFSPEVVWAQQDYIDTLEDAELEAFGGEEHDPDSFKTFRQRAGVDMLRYYKVPSMDIMGIEQSMLPKSIIPIKAPQGGVITEHRVREGMLSLIHISEPTRRATISRMPSSA